eukprot:scaffold3418_cov213-Prasinococcus_capsulatus_cf.AAC.3
MDSRVCPPAGVDCRYCLSCGRAPAPDNDNDEHDDGRRRITASAAARDRPQQRLLPRAPAGGTRTWACILATRS